MNFAELLDGRAQAQPDRPCIVFDHAPPSGLSYGELLRTSARYAAALRGVGARPGDRVLVQAEKSVACVATYLATLRIGAVYVPLNTSYTARELEYFVADSEPVLAVVDPARRSDLEAHWVPERVLDLDATGAGSLARAVEHHDPDFEIAPRADDDLAAIVYTSGTTGVSKGAMVTHANLASNAKSLVDLWGFSASDVLIHALPIFHVHGLFVALHVALLAGAKMLFLPRFDPQRIVELLPEATALMGVPTFYSRLLVDSGLDAERCASMRLFVSGSAPLTTKTFAEFEERTGHRILERYGMSEAGMITSNPLDGERVAGTVGFPLPGVEARVTGEGGAEVACGEVGVLEIRGPNLFRGYWRKPEKTAEEHRPDGFFITGDLATMDAEGRVAIVGRSKDLVISGGYNIYPKEIEATLDAMQEVVESAVIGAPHHDLGEGVVAVLVGSESEQVPDEEMRSRLADTLARFKHPRRFYWVDTLPRNAMGKVQKAVLRERYRDAYRASS